MSDIIKTCRVDGCNKKPIEQRKICGMHKMRWYKWKSYDIPARLKLTPGIVKICRIHGELKKSDCNIVHKKHQLKNSIKIYSVYLCKKCSIQRYNRWCKRNPNKRKEDYEKIKQNDDHRLSYYRQKLKKYGLTLEKYDKMLEEQNNKCKICKKHENKTDKRYGRTIKLSVDHCHKTGKVRSLLCSNCNAALGQVDDSIKLLKSMIEYLKAHQD